MLVAVVAVVLEVLHPVELILLVEPAVAEMVVRNLGLHKLVLMEPQILAEVVVAVAVVTLQAAPAAAVLSLSNT
jgi:hypothetical protein